MAEKTYEASEGELKTALFGVRFQAEAHGLDMTDGNLAEFLEHQAKFVACLFAQSRYLQSILDKEFDQ